MKQVLMLVMILGCLVQGSFSQTIFNKIKNKVAETASRQIEKGLEKQSGNKSGGSASTTEKESNSSTEEIKEEESPVKDESRKLESRTKFDFVPGDKVIFWEDFSQEAVGEFPAKWFTRSKGEVVTLNNAPGKWFRMYPGGFLSPTIDMKENYTVEFDLIMDWPVNGGFLVPSFGVSFYDRGSKMYVFSYDYRLENHMTVQLTPFRSEAYLTLSTRESKNSKFDSEKVKVSDFDKKSGKVVHVAMSIQKERIRMWLDEEKVFDVPSAAPYPGNLNQLKVEMNSSNYKNDQIGYYVSNFKIAKGSSDLREKLMNEGKLVTTGVKFDSNSDVIKPESYGTINEIAKIIKEDPSLRIRIVGHTDNSGNAADNLILSKKRADAVIKVLTEQYGVPAAQFQADGKGSTMPVTENNTAEGKAMNRRVEIIKL